MPDALMLMAFAAAFVAALAFAVYREKKARRYRESQRTNPPTSAERSAIGTAAEPPHAGPAGPTIRREPPVRPEGSGRRPQVQQDLNHARPGSPGAKPAPQGHADPSPQLEEPAEIDLAAKWNERVFAAAPKTHFMFQPIRRMLPEDIPTWYCPQLVIDGRDSRAIYTVNTDIELVVLQPVDSDENDPDDRLRTFLLPLSEDAFQVLHVPVSSGEIGCRVLSWQEVRLLLGRGFRSVGRDDMVDYRRPIPIEPWSDRCRLPEHYGVFYSVAVCPDDAQLVAQYATGRVLLHVRKLRPRGAVQTSYAYRHGVWPFSVCLTFTQRYTGSITAERRIYGRLLPFDEEMEKPPQKEAVVDVTAAGTVVSIYAPYQPPPEDPPGLRVVDRRRFAHVWRDYLLSKR